MVLLDSEVYGVAVVCDTRVGAVSADNIFGVFLMIGNYLKEIRAEKTLGQISAISGIDKGYLSKIERGERKPKIEMLEKLALAYEVEVYTLMKLAGYYIGIDMTYLNFAKQAQDIGVSIEDMEKFLSKY